MGRPFFSVRGELLSGVISLVVFTGVAVVTGEVQTLAIAFSLRGALFSGVLSLVVFT